MTTTTVTKLAENDAERCPNKTEKGRQCLLVIHPDSVKHKYVDRSNAVHVPLASVLPAGFTLTATEVKATDRVTKSAGRKDTKPRDADQKRVDRDALANYTKNHTKEFTTKTEWAKVILSEYIVPPKAVDAVLDYLRRAMGTGGSVADTQLRYRKGVHASGNTRVQWAFLDKAKP